MLIVFIIIFIALYELMIQWYPHGWMFVIYKIDSQEDEPYDTFSEVYTSYLDCLEAGIIRALNII